MKWFRLIMAAGVFLLFVATSSNAGPISQFPETCAAVSLSYEVNGFRILVGCSSKYLSTMPFTGTDDRESPYSAAQIVIAGMWPLQTGDVGVIHEAGRESVDLLLLLLAGSLLISISGCIKRVFRTEFRDPLKSARVHARSPYQEILTAQT